MSKRENQDRSPNGSEKGIHKLANETLAHIFLSGSLTLSTNLNSNTSSAFSLILVCHHWNTLALSLPSLWTTLDLDLHALKNWGQDAAEACLWKFASICLSRSSNQLLHLTLCHSIVGPMEKLANLGAISDRWVSLNTDSTTLTNIVNDRSNFSGFSKLCFLSLNVRSEPLGRISDTTGPIIDLDDDEEDQEHTGETNVEAPHLKYFQCRLRLSLSHRNDAQDAFFCLPHSLRANVTDLTIVSCAHLGTLSEKMRGTLTNRMARLTHLRLCLSSSAPAISNNLTPPHPTSLSLPHVTHLFVDSAMGGQSANHDDAWKHLSYLTLPSLTHLHVSQKQPEEEDPNHNEFFGRFLLKTRQVRSLVTRQVGLKHTMALIKSLNPETITNSNDFDDLEKWGVLRSFHRGSTDGATEHGDGL
ncbi:hypothetical protein D9611_013479 [Ephemerocybe angulata]|uniref:F-box domain-containing protein n=1 Tax=Ephemerocybe angulata TaxID=980116 RepID=A0A8H5FAA2_9AGAR|nr:hypothetical protein D9611_013479 [Tulosesus angulatus]